MMSTAVHCLAFDPRRPVLACGNFEKEVKLYEVGFGRPIGEPLRDFPGKTITEVKFSEDGWHAIVTDCMGKLTVRELFLPDYLAAPVLKAAIAKLQQQLEEERKKNASKPSSSSNNNNNQLVIPPTKKTTGGCCC